MTEGLSYRSAYTLTASLHQNKLSIRHSRAAHKEIQWSLRPGQMHVFKKEGIFSSWGDHETD